MSSRKLAAAAAALMLMVPIAANAQFGGALRRARERAANAIAGQAVQSATSPGQPAQAAQNCPSPTFDATMIELNSGNLDKFIRGLNAIQSAGEHNGRNTLARQLEADRARLEELESDPAISQAEQSQNEYQSCRQNAFNDILQARMQQMGPNIMTQYMRAMREHQERIAAARQRGDTLAAKQMEDSSWAVMSSVVATTHEDSVAVDGKCGRPPRVSRRVAERDSLRTVVREVGDSIRVLDEDAEDAVRGATGMTNRQFAMARERIEMFLSGNTCPFSGAERSAIDARKAELQRLLNH